MKELLSPRFHRLELHKTHLQPVLSVLSSYPNSPAQAWAQQIKSQLERCDVLESQVSRTQPVSDLLQQLQCQSPKEISVSSAYFQHANFQWSLKIENEKNDFLTGVLELIPNRDADTSALFLPSNQSADFSFLNPSTALFAFKGRNADGRGLYGPLLDNSQVQNIFGLGSIVGNLLADDRWAMAIYPPTTEAPVPMLVLAAGLSSDAVKNSLVTQFEKALTQQYQLTSHDIQKGQHIGKCFSHVPIFPALEPCVVVGPQSAIVSWNKIALENALTGNKAATQSKVGLLGTGIGTLLKRQTNKWAFLRLPSGLG